MKTLYLTLTGLLSLMPKANFQMSTSASFFEKTFGNENDRIPDEPILKPEFFQCDREKSCTNVVRFKSGKYKSVAGEAEMKKIKEVACIWTKYSLSTQNQHEPSSKLKTNKMPVCKSNERALGLESKAMHGNRITASSFKSQRFAYKGRLNGGSAWVPESTDNQPYFQVRLKKALHVSAVATQGLSSLGWTITYQIAYSNDTANFKLVTEALQSTPVTFSGNTDGTTIVKNSLPSPIAARYFRILPKTKSIMFAIRAEFYECDV